MSNAAKIPFVDLQTQYQNLKTDIDAAIGACDQQRGSMANSIRAGRERYQTLSRDSKGLEAEKQMAEVQRAIEEATMLEMPILEKNLIALSTIASISTRYCGPASAWAQPNAG